MAKAEAKTVVSIVTLLRKMELRFEVSSDSERLVRKGRLACRGSLRAAESVSIASRKLWGANWLTPAIVKVLRVRAGCGRGCLVGIAGGVVGEEKLGLEILAVSRPP